MSSRKSILPLEIVTQDCISFSSTCKSTLPRKRVSKTRFLDSQTHIYTEYEKEQQLKSQFRITVYNNGIKHHILHTTYYLLADFYIDLNGCLSQPLPPPHLGKSKERDWSRIATINTVVCSFKNLYCIYFFKTLEATEWGSPIEIFDPQSPVCRNTSLIILFTSNIYFLVALLQRLMQSKRGISFSFF